MGSRQNTRVGGVQLDYKFGVMTESGNRIHFLSSLKCSRDRCKNSCLSYYC